MADQLIPVRNRDCRDTPPRFLHGGGGKKDLEEASKKRRIEGGRGGGEEKKKSRGKTEENEWKRGENERKEDFILVTRGDIFNSSDADCGLNP